MIENLPALFKNNTTRHQNKHTTQSGKTRNKPLPIHLQGEAGKEMEKPNDHRTSGESEARGRRLFCIPP